jgi:GNAT superfamily N-acetyltransferase
MQSRFNLVDLGDLLSNVHSAATGNAMLLKIEDHLRGLFPLYPGIMSWYSAKVLPQILSDHGQRNIFCLVPTDYPSVMAAFCILKNGPTERKVCTLYVDKEYRGIGLGERLFEKAFEFLQTRFPEFSMKENAFSSYRHLIEKFQFVQTNREKDLDFSDYYEISFNRGLLVNNRS